MCISILSFVLPLTYSLFLFHYDPAAAHFHKSLSSLRMLWTNRRVLVINGGCYKQVYMPELLRQAKPEPAWLKSNLKARSV